MSRPKGISPIIATVLLIALVVVVGTMFSTWMTQWTTRGTGDQDLSCAPRTNYVIESAEYTNSTGVLKLKVVNKKEEELYGFGVILENATIIESFAYTSANISLSQNISESSKLGREMAVYLNLNLSGGSGIGYTLTKVKVTNQACKAVAVESMDIDINL